MIVLFDGDSSQRRNCRHPYDFWRVLFGVFGRNRRSLMYYESTVSTSFLVHCLALYKKQKTYGVDVFAFVVLFVSFTYLTYLPVM